jgi:hypothetical protein
MIKDTTIQSHRHDSINNFHSVINFLFLILMFQVVWMDHKGKVLTFEDRRIITDERISLERPYVKEWNLHVRNVSPQDDGKYQCQINTDPLQVRPVYLHVQGQFKLITAMKIGKKNI